MNLIYKTVVGSQLYGTAIETSDTDYKGIYVQPNEEILSFQYKEQIEKGKDETYYEIKRFLELARSGNPTILEMLFAPLWHPPEIATAAFTPLFLLRDKFLTKKCKNSFGGYAVQQIQKAKGLNKKMNWEKARVERKDVLDFCYVHEGGKSKPVKRWLSESNMDQKYCGLVALDKMPGCYSLYYDHIQQYVDEYGRGARNATGRGYSGIIGDDSNDVRLSSIAKTDPPPITVMSFNKDAYSTHCKDFREYEKWIENRNTQRYVDVKGHGQQIDGKNLLHCRRLIDCGIEIALHGTLTVKRPNADYLLKIRRGEVPLDDIINKAEEDLIYMDELFKSSYLPEDVDDNFLNDLILEIRCS